MSESRTPADARRAVDELEEKIVDEPDPKGRAADTETDKETAEKPVPGTEEPPD